MQYISAEGLEKLKKELEDRKKVKRREIAQHLEEAKGLGDLSENSEYIAAREDQAFNEGKILELEEIIKKAKLITPGRSRRKTVDIGAGIEVYPMDKRGRSSQQTFKIVGSGESDPARGLISNESPLGRAFLGHQAGDTVEVETPRGKLRYKIKAIK